MSPRSTIVLLDDYEEWLNTLKNSIIKFPESSNLDIVSFTHDEDASAYVARHHSEIIGYIQDLHRDDSDLNKLHGIQFFNQVIDTFTPNVKTLFNSAYVPYDVMHKMYRISGGRIDFLDKREFSLKEFRERFLWLLTPLTNQEIPQDQLKPFNTPQEVSLIVPAWEEICRYIYKNPSFLHQMNPRKFEELIAQYFADYGWKVDITAQTRDGGYDIIAVRREYPADIKLLIEAKRFAPNRPVGVQIVRSLYGIKMLTSSSQVVLATSSHVSSDAKKEFKHKVPWELNFIERDEILDWCRRYGGVTLDGTFES